MTVKPEVIDTPAEGAKGNPVDVSTIPLQLPVAQAWSRVMGDVRFIGKDRTTTGGAKYAYRGVDDVMQDVGPSLRKHGVTVLPRCLSLEHRDVLTAKGSKQHEVIVSMGYTIFGPLGDVMEGGAYGESADSSDKATSQAMSVAFRTFLLQGLCIPTGDPDPDENHIERSGSPSPAQARPKGQTDSDGWDSTEQRDKAWASLFGATQALDGDEVTKWCVGAKLDPDTFTMTQAAQWQDVLEAARDEAKRSKPLPTDADNIGKEGYGPTGAWLGDPNTEPFG